jgi:hypothetical protein
MRLLGLLLCAIGVHRQPLRRTGFYRVKRTMSDGREYEVSWRGWECTRCLRRFQ